MSTKYIFITGGVISGLGKGITSASLGRILMARGYRVAPIKCDAYVNVDAGTMNPIEHGEVFVTDDGIETDQDIGHYERFLGIDLDKTNYTTVGQIYLSVIQRERNLEYNGSCVEVVPHVPEEVIRRIKRAGQKRRADIVLVEIGGTVGEYQNALFMEAARMMEFHVPGDVLHVHVGYLPIPQSIGEMKSKPVQYSVRTLNSVGIQPDFVVCRSEKRVDEKRKQKIAVASNMDVSYVISNPDLESIYEVPLVLEEQEMSKKILKKLGLKTTKADLSDWKKMVKTIHSVSKPVKIGVIGKYFSTGDFLLEDSYVCVIEAIKHACWASGLKPDIRWFDSETIAKQGTDCLQELNGIIVPQGWGSRGTQGKIQTIQYAREQKVPYLGLCFGMQHAVIEFARNVCGLANANSEEVDPNTDHPVIHVMDYQKEILAKKQFGGTIRLGSYPCKLKAGTLLSRLYGRKRVVNERHRHRYEFNGAYRELLEKAGLVISGTSPDGSLVEAIELPGHPFFLGTQYHPELKSRPLDPHPVFVGFIKAAAQ